MFVQALAEYADHNLARELDDRAWETRPVPWLLKISERGKFLAATPHMATVTRGDNIFQVPVQMSVPRSPANRNNGEHPLLGTDEISYVLGVGAWTPARNTGKEKAIKHHEAFVALLRKAAADSGDAALASCVRFYANLQEVQRARDALRKARAGALVALAVGEPLLERESVRQYWQKQYQAEFADRMESSEGECMISGKFGPIAPTHERIKGVSSLGGQTAGVALMSFDKGAFRSYGWEQNRNSPISPDRALAYVLAFNELLKPDTRRRKDIAGIGVLCWLKNPADFDAVDLMDRADSEQVKRILSFEPGTEPDINRFYMLAVSGNGGRLRIRYWADLALTQVRRNLKNWYEQLCVAYPWDDRGPVRLWELLYALDREGKPDVHAVLAVLRRGIEGIPLGYSVLSKALARLRHHGGANAKEKAGDKKSDPLSLAKLRAPVALIRMCINDLFRQQKGIGEVGEGLDVTCTTAAYICGRLMAEFENLHRSSSDNGLNSSVLARNFALASTFPAAVFGQIESLGQKHLHKLRRGNPPAAYTIDARLQELQHLLQLSACGAYPGMLGLEGQGLFVLGYYHQKAGPLLPAHDREQINESRMSNSDRERA